MVWKWMQENNATAFKASEHFKISIEEVWEQIQKPKEVAMCITPKTMTLELCKSCKRYTKEETEATEMFNPVKNSFTWKCDGYINLKQGNLF